MSENLDIDMELDEFLSSVDAHIKGSDTTAETPTAAAVEVPPAEDAKALEVAAEVKAREREEELLQEKAKLAAQQEREKATAEEPTIHTGKAVEQKDGTALKSYVDASELKRDVAISPTDLDNDMIKHAALYVHYAEQTVNARRQYDRVKSQVEILEAQLDAHYRNKANDEGKKTTEAQLKSQVTSDPRYAAAQQKLIDAHSIWKLADIAERAMDQRKDMLLEVARDRRKEKEGQVRVLELKAQKEAIMEAMRQRAA